MLARPWHLIICIVTPLLAETAWDMHTRQGMAWEKQGRYAEAAQEFRAAAETADPGQLPVTLDSLGVIYRQLGQYREAEGCHRRAIALWEAAGAGHGPDLATALENLGALRLAQSRPSQAGPLYERAYDLRVQSLGPEARPAGFALHGMARAAHGQRRYAEAEDLYRRALAVLAPSGGEHSTGAGDVLHDWGVLYRETGRNDAAVSLLERAAATYQKSWPLHPKLAIILRNLAEAEAEAGRVARAQELFERSVHICEASLPPDHPQTGVILQAYGKFLRTTHHKAEAGAVERRASAILAKTMRAQGGSDAVDLSELRRK